MTTATAQPTRTRDRRIGEPMQSVQANHDATMELHREIQRLNDVIAEKDKQLDEQTNTPAVIDNTAIIIKPRMDIAALMERDQFIRDVIDNFLVPGIDFGPLFPNAKENGLKKSGAEKFAAAFGLFADYIEVEKVVDRAPDSVLMQHVRYEYRCDLHIGSRGGPIVGTAIGVCSSEEEKYKYRKAERVCPECDKPYVRRSTRTDKDGDKGWYCWNNPSKNYYGCGAQFHSEDPRIISQNVDRTINPDMMGLQHTISAIAQKRAFVLAVRTATGLSAYFAEIVIDDDETKTRTVIDGKASHKSSASIAAELIKYAESLLPVDHGYSRNQIGAVCLDVLGMRDWNDDYKGTIDDAKQAIARRINEKFGNGEPSQKPHQNAETTPKNDDSEKDAPPQAEPANAPEIAVCTKCEKSPRTDDDSPYPFFCTACRDEQLQKDASK